MARRRLGATERDQVRFEVAVCLALIDAVALGSAKCCFQAFLDEALLDAVDLPWAHPQDLGDLFAGLLVVLERALVHTQQNDGVQHGLAGVLPFGFQLCEEVALLFGQGDLVKAWHSRIPT